MIMMNGLAALMILFGMFGAGPHTAATIVSQSEDVRFQGGQGVSLTGTLQVPASKGKLPAVLILGDFGNTTRDAVSYGKASHTIYRDLAGYLTGKGFAVLRFDKRCVGSSACQNAESFEDFVDDARGAVAFLRGHERVDPSRIFMFGHGEGGLIASSIAAHDENAFAGVILAGTAGRTIGKVLKDQFTQQMTEEGKSQAEIDKYMEKYDRIIRGMISGATSFPNEKLDPAITYDAILQTMIRNYAINRALLINDPLQIVNGIQAPILIIQGRKDLMVAVKDAEYLEEALKRAYHPDHKLHLLDNLTHMLKNNPGEPRLAFNQDASKPLDPQVLEIIGEWITKRNQNVRGDK